MAANIWRKVEGVAVLCNDCECNIERPLYMNDEPVGKERICTAKDDICVRLGKRIEDDKRAYENFKDMFQYPVYEEEEE